MQKMGSINKCLAFLSGIIISLTVIFYSYSYILKSQLLEQGKNILSDLMDATVYGYDVIESLNNQNFTYCSDENLLAMRKSQFESNDIRDIGFLENGVLTCTTGIGILKAPINKSSYDFMLDGHEFWFNHKLITFDRTVQGIIIRKDNYNLVASFQGILSEHRKFKSYEVIALKGEKIIHLFGAPGIYQKKSTSSHPYF
ncbi:MAG: sensor c-di-GMP phosphodiesterase-like protein, partial [Colwellia sp.]